MSFILDALRRAETQRGNQPSPVSPDSALGGIAEKTASMPSPRWVAVLLIAALAIAMLATNALRPRDPATNISTALPDNRETPQTTGFSAIAADTPLVDVATPATREVRPLGREARTAPAPVPTSVPAPENNSTRTTPGTVSVSQQPLSASETPARTLTNLPASPPGDARVPSYTEMVLDGRGQMPEFHLDIHVYAAAPERRFVFVNNRKYREGAQLDEGGTVERITPAGVILNYRGRRFELVPD